jgi:dCTP deaminase
MTLPHSSFWSSDRIKEEQKRCGLINPFDGGFVKQSAYELALGSEVFITTETTKRKLTQNEQLSIPPGQFALLLTDEQLNIPSDVIGFISVRYTIKRKGLINVSGFHVDPGYCGRLKFAVYNAGSRNIVLSRGQRAFMIWFSNLTEPTPDPYQNNRVEQNEITPEDVMSLQGDVASPAALKLEIDDLRAEFAALEDKTSTRSKLTTGLLVTLAVELLMLILVLWFQRPTTIIVPQTPPQAPHVQQNSNG